MTPTPRLNRVELGAKSPGAKHLSTPSNVKLQAQIGSGQVFALMYQAFVPSMRDKWGPRSSTDIGSLIISDSPNRCPLGTGII
jgi:hypothetical protein